MSQTETPDGRVMYTYSDDSVVTIDNSVFGDANWTYTDTGDIYSADTDGNLSVDLAYRNNIGSDGAAIDFVNSVSDRLDNGDGTFTVITTDLSTGDISTATEDENGNTFSIKTGESAITDLYNKYGSSSSDSFMTAFKKDIDRLVSGGGIGPWVFVLEGKAMKMGKFYDFKTGLIETWNFLGDSIQEIGNFTDYYGNHSARRANADQAVYLLEFQKIRELKKRQDDPWRPESIEMGSLYYKNSDIMALDFRLQNPEIANVYTLPEKQLGPTVQAAKEKDLYDRLDLKSDTDYNLISSACDGSLDHIAENKVVPVDLNIEEQCQEYIDEQLDKSWLDSSLDFFANVSDAGSTVSQSISRLAEYANFLPTYDAEDPNNPIRLANIEGDLRSQGRYLSESQIREEQRSISNKVYLKFAQEYNQYTKAVQDKKTEYTNLGCGINSMADQSCGSLAREIATITEKQNDAEYMLSNPSSLVSESNLKFADTTASEVDKNDQSLDALSQDIYDDRAIREGQADSVMDMIEQINQMNLMIYQDLADINQVVVAISNLPVCDWK
ncbi:MAG: hypothetical protein U9Q15_00110 [Patescibacteria group bacterium]|nr:hypothetical protein [Patescibacteria group bacterium]